METFRIARMVAKEGLYEWRKNGKILVLILLSTLLIVIYIGKIPFYSVNMKETNTPFLMPLLFSDSINVNGSIKILLFLGTVFLFSDAPFFSEEKLFFMLRTHRKGWWIGEIMYIVAAAFIYTAWIAAVSAAIGLPNAGELSKWGSIIDTILYGDWEIQRQIVIGISVPETVIIELGPIYAMLYTAVTVWMDMVLIGLLMYTVNLCTKKRWPGVASATAVVLAAPAVHYLADNTHLQWYLFSPVSWSSIENWKICLHKGKLSFSYIISAFCLLSSLMILITNRKVKKMDICIQKGDQ